MSGQAVSPYLETVASIRRYIELFSVGECPPATLELCLLSITPVYRGWYCELIDGNAIFDFSAVCDGFNDTTAQERANFVFKLFIIWNPGDNQIAASPGALLYASRVNLLFACPNGCHGVTTAGRVDYIEID